MKRQRCVCILIICAAAFTSLVTSPTGRAQTTSGWLALGTSADWFDPINWASGVPLLPGDTAQLPAAPKFSPTIGSTNSVSLGRLDFLGTGAVAINGTGSITFSNPGVAPAAISSPGLPARAVTIAPALIVSSGELLSLEPAVNSTFAFTSGLGSGTGDAAVNGTGRVTLSGGNANWSGQMTVNSGQLVVSAASALGSSSAGTVINGGVVTLNAVVAEPLTLQSGALETTVAFLDLNGPLNLPAGNTAVVRGPLDILGGSGGAGGLSIVASQNAATTVRSMPLSHQGGVKLTSALTTRQFAKFSIDNSYLGPTEIVNIQLEVETANGLGSFASGTTVSSNGLLRLHGGSRESVSLTDSTLALWSAETTLSELRPAGNIKLKNSTLTTYGQFRGAANYVVEQPVQLDGGLNTISTERGALTLAGGLTGTGDLLLNPTNGFPINVTVPIQNDLKPELRSGSLRLLVPDAFTGELFLRNSGQVVAETNQHMSRVRTGALVNTGCCSPSGGIEVAPGASLTANHIDITQGVVRGTVHTPEGLRFDGFIGGRTISHLDVDKPVRIKAGELTLDDSVSGRSPTRAPIRIERSSEASVFISPRSISDADFYLNNGSGFNFGGALLSENDSSSLPALTLRGDIYLGSNGAHIGGSDHLRIQGQIYGGDLNLGHRGDGPGLVIEANTPAYTGVSRFFSGEVIVAESGRLSNTSAIELYPLSRLSIEQRPIDGVLSDRVADAIPIRMFGGQLSNYPTAWGMNTSERVGRISLERGVSTVQGTHYYSNSLQSHADLIVGEIVRSPGALLEINGDQTHPTNPFTEGRYGIADFVLENRPQLVNGILPAWSIIGGNFTAYDQNGRVASYKGPTIDLATATDTSIARPSPSGTTLAADKTIHALYASGNTGPVDLNGRTLTVGSGGVSGARISNGTIRPGQYSNGELIFFGGNTINASIVDNGSPTSVIYTGDMEIGGVNTYTGKTYVNGRLGDNVLVNNSKSLPSGTSVEIAGGGELFLRAPGPNNAYVLGDVAIRDRSTLVVNCCGNGESLTARSILLESGNLRATLVGNFPISKQTDGAALIDRASPGFTGQIDIAKGNLRAGDGASTGYLAFGSGTVNVLASGRLTLSPASTAANSPIPTIRLLGGSLFGISTSSSDGFISMRGTLDVVESSAIYLLDGAYDRPRNAPITVDGIIRVAPGKTLSVIGRPDTSSQGLQATQGFQFGNGSVLAGNAVINANVQIGNGVTLSPGLAGEEPTVGLLATSIGGQKRMTWSSGGRYRWEINDADEDAGAPFGRGWDVMRIGSFLDLTSTPTAPFIIEPVPLRGDGEAGAVAGLVPHRQYRWMIVEIGKLNAYSATITGFAANKFAVDASKFNAAYPGMHGDFWLEIDTNGIYLNSMLVPEPASGCLAAVVFGTVLLCRGRRRSNPPFLHRKAGLTRP